MKKYLFLNKNSEVMGKIYYFHKVLLSFLCKCKNKYFGCNLYPLSSFPLLENVSLDTTLKASPFWNGSARRRHSFLKSQACCNPHLFISKLEINKQNKLHFNFQLLNSHHFLPKQKSSFHFCLRFRIQHSLVGEKKKKIEKW